MPRAAILACLSALLVLVPTAASAPPAACSPGCGEILLVLHCPALAVAAAGVGDPGTVWDLVVQEQWAFPDGGRSHRDFSAGPTALFHHVDTVPGATWYNVAVLLYADGDLVAQAYGSCYNP